MTTLRELIAAEPDVRAVLELEPVGGTNDWLYLIETPFDSFPRYVIGRTDASMKNVRIVSLCGHLCTARATWTAAQAFRLDTDLLPT